MELLFMLKVHEGCVHVFLRSGSTATLLALFYGAVHKAKPAPVHSDDAASTSSDSSSDYDSWEDEVLTDGSVSICSHR